MKQFLVKKPIRTFKIVKLLKDNSFVPYFFSDSMNYALGELYEKDDFSFEKKDAYFSYDMKKRGFWITDTKIITFEVLLGFIPNPFTIFTYREHPGSFDLAILECEIPEGSHALRIGQGKIASNKIRVKHIMYVLDWEIF